MLKNGGGYKMLNNTAKRLCTKRRVFCPLMALESKQREVHMPELGESKRVVRTPVDNLLYSCWAEFDLTYRGRNM